MKALFAAGGTGGHVFPALAVAQELMKEYPASAVLFVGTEQGIEATLVPKAGFRMEPITIHGLKRSLALSNLTLPFLMMKSLRESLRIINRFAPNLVFGAGGFVSGPVVLAAVIKGVPTVIHEQNIQPGLTTKWLARWASMVLLSLPQTEVYLKRKDNLRLTGNPIRFEFGTGDRLQARRHFGLQAEMTTMLVFGGSLGAHSVNMAVLESLPDLMAEQNLQILWQTGKADVSTVQEQTRSYGGRIVVLPFIDEMGRAYQAADLVLCRAGATTLAEISVIGLPAVLVPYPFATANHQELNAAIFCDAGAAEMILDRDLSGSKVASVVLGLVRDPEKRKAMADQSTILGRPQAAADIVKAMTEVARN